MNLRNYFAAALCALISLPALAQVERIPPLQPQARVPFSEPAARAYMAWQDTVINQQGMLLKGLVVERDQALQREADRVVEVGRLRQRNDALMVENSQWQERFKKSINLPVQKPFLLDPHTWVGTLLGGVIVGGAVIYVSNKK